MFSLSATSFAALDLDHRRNGKAGRREDERGTDGNEGERAAEYRRGGRDNIKR